MTGGVDIRTVQELLGHKDIRVTMRYAHLAPDHMKSAVQVLIVSVRIERSRFLMDTIWTPRRFEQEKGMSRD